MWWKLDHDRKKQHNMVVVLSRLDRRLAPIVHKRVDEALNGYVHTMTSQALDSLLQDHPELTQALGRRVTATLLEEFVKLEASDTSYQTGGRDADTSGSDNGTFSTPSLFVRRGSCDEETVKIFHATPIIRPMSHLRTKTHELRDLARVTQETIFLTKRGYGYVVVMSLASYRQGERNIARLENRLIARAPVEGRRAARRSDNQSWKAKRKDQCKVAFFAPDQKVTWKLI